MPPSSARILVGPRALAGPNAHARFPVVQATVSPDAPETSAGDVLAACPEVLAQTCAPDCPLAGSLAANVDAAHAIAHLARHLLERAGQATSWGQSVTRADGTRLVVVACDEETSGLLALELAAQLLHEIAAGRAPSVDAKRAPVASARLAKTPSNLTVRALLDEAERRRIPIARLGESLYQLGYGARQHRIQGTLTSRTSLIAAELANDKMRTKKLLRDAGVPVAQGRSATTYARATSIAQEIGYPVVVKPRTGQEGGGVTVHVANAEELRDAFERASRVDRHVLVEAMLRGDDFRLLVIGHTFVAAIRREPAHVIGDGARSIRQLVADLNADPARGQGRERPLTRIMVDDDTLTLLAKQGLSIEDVPREGHRVRLKSPASLMAGATAIDVTELVHPDVREMAEHASRIIGLDVCGIDLVAPDLARPLRVSGGGVCEINARPSLRGHLFPRKGKPRNVAASLVDHLFPRGTDGRIPVVAVTGTNGKTTTARLIAHVLARAGAMVGLACTDGVEIRGRRALATDRGRPSGAEIVLRAPTVTHAVLEVGRPEILRRGLAFDACDVGIILNVDHDGLEADGATTLDELAHAKAAVVRAVRPGGIAVLNAEDPRSLACAPVYGGRVVLVAIEEKAVREHTGRGGEAVVVRDGTLTRLVGTAATPLARIAEIPVTLEGDAECNVRNVLAAAAAALHLGVAPSTIGESLRSLQPGPAHLPGRLNVFDTGGVKVLVDRGRNIAALQAAARVLPRNGARRIAAASAPSAMGEDGLRSFGAWLASQYDEVHLWVGDAGDERAPERHRLVAQAASGSSPAVRIEMLDLEAVAIEGALASARRGDTVILHARDVELALRMVDGWRPARGAPRSAAAGSTIAPA